MTKPFSSPLSSIGYRSVAEITKAVEPVPLIDGLLFEESLICLFGPSGVGKTFVLLDIMFHIGFGIPWNSLKVSRGAVVYNFGEGESGLARRLDALFQCKNRRKGHAPIVCDNKVVNLFHEHEVRAYIERLKALQAISLYPLKLVVFDTLARCAVGADENSNRDMGVIVKHCDLIRTGLGVAVMLIHHTGWTHGKERGASALRGALDTCLSLSAEGKAGLKLEVEKQKDGEKGGAMLFELEPVELPRNRTSCVVGYRGRKEASNENGEALLSANQRAVYDVIASNDGSPWDVIRSLCKEAGLGQGRSSALAELKDVLIRKDVVRLVDGKLFVM